MDVAPLGEVPAEADEPEFALPVADASSTERDGVVQRVITSSDDGGPP